MTDHLDQVQDSTLSALQNLKKKSLFQSDGGWQLKSYIWVYNWEKERARENGFSIVMVDLPDNKERGALI